MNIKMGNTLTNTKTGERFKVTCVFCKNESVHALPYGKTRQRKVTGFTFKQIEETMEVS